MFAVRARVFLCIVCMFDLVLCSVDNVVCIIVVGAYINCIRYAS